MAIVVESTASSSGTSGTVTITKPTGLQVGELLVGILGCAEVGGLNVNTHAGWTSSIDITGGAGSSGGINLQYKVADSSDVAASNFSFTDTGPAALIAGSLLRVSGVRPSGFAGVSESDVDNSGSGRTTVAFTASSTPITDGSLVVMCIVAGEAAGVATMGSYATTPSATWTEASDHTENSGSFDPVIGTAYTVQATAAEITEYSSVSSIAKQDWVGAIATFYPTVDANGTTTLLSISPTQHTPVATAGTNGTVGMQEVAPVHNAVSGAVEIPVIWTDEPRGSTTWTDEPRT